MINSKNKKTEVKVDKKPASKGLTAKQIVKRHIQNKNDKITEDDIKNVNIDHSLPKDKAHQPLPISPDTERPKDEDKDNNRATPWDVISE
jgi:hypothetical protein